tara:strand:- start:316 stop:1596 length:1281 start_codon:yes stop_codon:yes gene_type:complete
MISTEHTIINNLKNLKEELLQRLNTKNNKNIEFDTHYKNSEVLLKNKNINLSYIDLIPEYLLTNQHLNKYKSKIFSGSRSDDKGITHLHTCSNGGNTNSVNIDSIEVFYDYCILHFAPEFYDNSLYSCDYLQKGQWSCAPGGGRQLIPNFDDFDKIKENYKLGILGYKSNYECPYCNHKSKYGNRVIEHHGSAPSWKCSSFNPVNMSNVIYNDVIMIQIKEEFYDLLWKHKLNELYIDKIQKQILEIEIEITDVMYKMFNNILELNKTTHLNSTLISNESNNRKSDLNILQKKIEEFSIDNSNNIIILNDRNNKLLNELYIDKIQKQMLENEVEITNLQDKTYKNFLKLEKTIIELQNINIEQTNKVYISEILENELKKCNINTSNYFENKMQIIINIIIIFYIFLTVIYNNLPLQTKTFLSIGYE